MKNNSKKSKRTINTKEKFKTVLIMCEGEKTEVYYFEDFRDDLKKSGIRGINIEVTGTGYNTVSLVNEAIKEKNNGSYHSVWAVFDKDDFNQFNGAIQIANANNINVAYSNEAFELWYLLHFNYHDTAMSRKDYEPKLTGKIGRKYEKNSEGMYATIKDKQNNAIRNAKNLLNEYKPGNDKNFDPMKITEGFNPANNNPSTTVHLLVEELNTYI
ncbi:MAG: RloB domain-containing protein [Magnetococcales bacterium]|nr:RloB domain-containing protein [Nitrospirota bacterium]